VTLRIGARMEREPAAAPSSDVPPGAALLYLVFFLSGAAALADEVVWFKYLTLVFGATTPATATLLAVFMAGLALGSRLAGRFAPRLLRPRLAYAVLEAGVGLFALATPLLFHGVEWAYVHLYRALGAGSPLLLVRILLSAAALLVPTMLMGATYPVLVRDLGAGTLTRRRSGLLYGINTAGAVAGTALCGFVAIPTIGMHATLLTSGLLSLVAAALAALRPGRPSLEAAPVAAQPERLVPFLAFLGGLVAMADEVLWTRILVLHLGSSVYTFSLVLTVYLIGLVAGSLAGATVREENARRHLVKAQIAILAITVLQAFAFTVYGDALTLSAVRLLGAHSHGALVLAEALTTAVYLFPPTFCFGFCFTLLLKMAPGGHTQGAALVYSANTLGSILGSLAAGFLLVPLIGTQRSLLLMGALAAAGSLLLDRKGVLRVATAIAVLLAVPALFLPKDAVIRSAGVLAPVEGMKFLFFDEDRSGVVAVKASISPPGLMSLEINGVNVAGIAPGLVMIQKLQAHLPLALAANPERVLHVGVGSGGTAYSASLHPVKEIDIVEISPTVLQAAKTHFGAVNHGVFADPRVKVFFDDGRSFALASPFKFDVVLSDSIHPRFAGNGYLYTEEYFRLCRERLAPDGVISMWLPTYSMLPSNYRSVVRAFQDVFPNVWIFYPHTVPNAFTVVMATPQPTISLAQLARRVEEPAVKADLQKVRAADPAELLSFILMGPRDVARWAAPAVPHSDDIPSVEYESGRLLESASSRLRIMEQLLGNRGRIEEMLSDLTPGDALSERVIARYRESSAVVAGHVALLRKEVSGR